MTNLSDAQSIIVHAGFDRAIQVLASAGSGKTRVLTERVRFIIGSTKKDGVIAFTFTNKAAEEMRLRLSDLADLEERCWIATVHSVAQRILDQYGHAIGLPSELHIYERDKDRKEVFLQSIVESGRDINEYLHISEFETLKERDRLIQNYMDSFSAIKRELLTDEEISERFKANETFLETYQLYQEALLRSGGIDFDDILVYAHQILLEQPWCGDVYRAKYKHLCVDEAQDLNKAQYEFLKVLCGEKIKSVMLVGDPNQMIYGFNGSSEVYLCKNFLADFNPTVFQLKENYRSSKAVIDLSNKLKPGAQVSSNFAFKGASHFETFANEKAEASWVCEKIQELMELKTSPEIEGAISLDKIVVIGRNKFVFQSIEEALRERHIPYSLKMGERQVEPSSVFGKVLDLSIRVRINSKDWIAGQKLCETLKIPFPNKWGNDSLLIDFAKAIADEDVPFRDEQKKLLEAIQKLDLDEPNVPKLCKSLEDSLKALAKPKLKVELSNELERSIQELLDFKNQWTVFRKKGLGESLSSFRNALALGQLSQDQKSDGLTLSTVHTMKGLEKDIVFLVGMCEGVFPDYRATTKKKIEEEKNSAFVAITRARRWIFVSAPLERVMPWGATRNQEVSQFVTQMMSTK